VIERPRVLLLIPHLGGGGSERVFALLARGLSHEKYELHLCVVTGEEVAAGAIPAFVTVHILHAKRVRSAAFRLISLVRQLRPQVILCGMFHLNFLILLLRPFFPRSVQVFVRQNGTVSAALAQSALPIYTRLLYRVLYPRADRVICQSTAMANDLTREINLPEQNMIVLPNPIELERLRSAVSETYGSWTGSGPHLLAIGRLSREKGFDLLLQALVTVREQFAHCRLVIAGSGPEEAALKALSDRLGLESAVTFAGYVDDPSIYFPGASLFVLSSRHEGLPNALLEAAAGGLPIVASPASDGIRDLLRGQPGTWLATEVSTKALAETLLAALTSLETLQRFQHSFIDDFRFDRAIRCYEALIDASIAGAGHLQS
jgi:glycosyltransferase involved in cell wall biosynthesis